MRSKLAPQLDRRDLIHAVWAAEFTRALGGTQQAELAKSAAILRLMAARAANSADRAVEALRLYVDVEFELASYDELECYVPWDEFVASSRSGTIVDDDGHGELATDDHHVANVRVLPSDALDPSYVRPDWATHVIWYKS